MCIYADSHALDMCIYLDSGVFIKTPIPIILAMHPPRSPPFSMLKGMEFVFDKMCDFYAEVGARVASLPLNIELGGTGGGRGCKIISMGVFYENTGIQ